MNDFLIYYDNEPVALVEFSEGKNANEERWNRLNNYTKFLKFESLLVNGVFWLPAEAMVFVSGSSTGTQVKYFYENVWYKLNKVGYEDVAEVLVSKVLSCSNMKNYVSYKKCVVNKKKSCCSVNFLGMSENYISLQRLYQLYYNRELLDTIRSVEDVKERIDYIIDFVKSMTGLDMTEYLGKMLCLDMLILNTDRHFNNIGLIVNKEMDQYRLAPIFDNGNSLLSNISEFPFDVSIEENIEKAVGQPFAANLERQAMELGFGLKINYSKLYQLLENEPESRALEVLKYQLNRYEKIIRDDRI